MPEQLKPISNFGMTDLIKELSGGTWDFDPSPLAGRALAAVEVSEDKERLTFRFQEGQPVSYEAAGDCCSRSWIEHVTVPPDVVGSEITGWSEQTMGEVDADEYECVRVYQTSFVTPKGEIIVEYRNSSNGYYGGWLSGPVAESR